MAERDNAPNWTGKPGHYEVWFLTMSDGVSGYWLRWTLLAPDRGPAEARVWFARFDRDDPKRALAFNRAYPIDALTAGRDPFLVRIGASELGSGRTSGSLEGAGHDVSWHLDFDHGQPTYRLLPDRLYHGGLAPTKPFSPNVSTRFTGEVRVDGEARELIGMAGQQGHLYGTKHAERWAWAHCGVFAGHEDAVVHALTAQGRRGPVTTPFTTFAGLKWGGRWYRFSGVARKRPFWLGGWRIDLGTRHYRLTGRVAADPSMMVQAEYHDPDGTPRYCHNTEVGSSRFVLFERGEAGFEEVAVLSSEGTTHAEWAGRTPAPGAFTPHATV
jgi:hypothetical protein